MDGLRYGYEEALGYCVDPEGVRDKDGITAALLVTELASELKHEGRTLLDLLDDLAVEHGLHATDQLSVRVEDLSLIADAMRRLREQPPTRLAGLPVTKAEDLTKGTDTLPPTDGLRYTLDGRPGHRPPERHGAEAEVLPGGRGPGRHRTTTSPRPARGRRELLDGDQAGPVGGRGHLRPGRTPGGGRVTAAPVGPPCRRPGVTARTDCSSDGQWRQKFPRLYEGAREVLLSPTPPAPPPTPPPAAAPTARAGAPVLVRCSLRWAAARGPYAWR